MRKKENRMRQNQNQNPLLWLLPVPMLLWLAALLATEYKAGMTVFTLMGRFSWLMEHPFSVRWTPHTPKFILWALAAYGFAVALYLSTRENRRPGEEHGSAKWGSAKRLNAKYRDKDPRNNTILTQNVRMSLNGKMHRRNLLQIVIGGSGAGTRTRSVSKGRSGSSSVNYQQTGRELMTPDEVRVLDNDHCILFIRGELPVMDRKYDILKHPSLKLTEDGGAAPYIHRPGLTYALEDLPLSTDSWESIEIIE